MKTSDQGIALIKEFEGCVLTAYPDPGSGGDPWTIGYGTTKGVVPGMKITQEEAEALLRDDLEKFEKVVDEEVKVSLNQNQFDALVSFTYNVGPGALQSSTLLKLLNAGNYGAVGVQLLRWNKGPNGPMPGLTRRRAAERKMFDGLDWN